MKKNVFFFCFCSLICTFVPMKKILANLLYGLLYLTSLLPLWVHYLISDMFYVLIYKVVHYRVKLVRKNLSDSFPEKTEKEVRDIERRFYHWFCDYLVETVKLLTISEKHLKRRMVFKGAEVIDQLVKEGRSAAIYLGHYCNWEWVTSLPLWVTTEAHCGQIYHALENKEFDMLSLKLRQRFNAECIPMAETLRRIVKYKQEGKPVVIGYISDQVPFWNNIHHWCQFLNHDTPVLTGTERLARQTNHAVFYLEMNRPKRGYYEAQFRLIASHPQQLGEYEITDAYFSMLEENIRRAPEFWLWTHNRWKRTREEFNLRYDSVTGRVNLDSLENIKRQKGIQ